MPRCMVPSTHRPSEGRRGGAEMLKSGIGRCGAQRGEERGRDGRREKICDMEREITRTAEIAHWLTLSLHNHSFISYRTGHYKLHYYETPTNLKFVMVTDTKSHNLRIVLHQIYVGLYVEYGMCFVHSTCLWCEKWEE